MAQVVNFLAPSSSCAARRLETLPAARANARARASLLARARLLAVRMQAARERAGPVVELSLAAR